MDADETMHGNIRCKSAQSFLVGLWFAECLATIDEYDSASVPQLTTLVQTPVPP